MYAVREETAAQNNEEDDDQSGTKQDRNSKLRCRKDC
jgi:hypothetical protein